ncbi:MAG TPA: hypothetical protein VL738_01870 [Dactylosporangium sp.]|nr:hypothetical protein [Dactylosporangium sp.]
MAKFRRFAWPAALLSVSGALVLFAWLATANPRHYTHLMRYGKPAFVVMLVAFAVGLVVLATVLALRAGTRRRVVGITGAVLTVLGFCAGEFVVSFDLSGTDAIGSPRVVAVSADGAFELTVQPYGGWWVVYDVVQLRTRDGLRSRQSDRFVGCFAYHDDVQPEEVFSGARFTGPGEIEVSMQSGHTWTTTFDAATLRPAGQIMYGCEDAGSDAFTPR